MNKSLLGTETILITGGAGYLGSVLVQKLLEAKKEWRTKPYVSKEGDIWIKNISPWIYSFKKIIVYDNLMYKQTSLINYCYRGDFEFVYGDVRDQEKLLSYIKKADVIIPLAAIVGFPACERDKNLADEVNYKQIKFIVDNMIKGAKLIYPNTNSGYGIGEEGIYCTEETPLRPVSHYGITKCAAEKEVLKYGGVSLRLATVFGVSPRMRLDLLVNDFTFRAYKEGYITLFESKCKRNFIHIQDVALVFIRSIIDYNKMGGEAYNVGRSDSNLSKLELAEKVKEYIPGFIITCNEYSKDSDQRDYIVSNEKLEKLNWKPYYTLDAGIQELIRAYSIISPTLTQYTNL